ncbi:MAG: glutamine--fructose-6-phosphate transaminase (isomerizing) [Chloroflexi bacterium]|uniref:Glutamine--fructose-6-phosphate aminotransferase [isomerizing] n=1 Tax=Candidatus Chlorohelix allophototropha TaxID=3003348 RepID=A0A8T7M1B0_9CHLR|nr:glutamine--fructose-6-phosphate transaminase (isomerizing) [Chloroflexota bacterium]WJW66073.1 glutamine--fructose-6-phosphate transaminase (isomerizing) [Chloroflexota bacterium L227-S17]
MCGIIGYVGSKQALPVIIEGLQRLEYRGYDSAGIALISPAGNIEVRRAVGKLQNLVTQLQEEPKPLKGSVGMGHTRWATHGKPTELNAHPHRGPQSRVVVVHNGIIENYVQLKQELVQSGYSFNYSSETDTEVIAHLLEKCMLREGDTLEQATIKTLNRLKGTAAIVAISLDDPEKIVAARLSNAGAVVIGYGAEVEHEMFIASDIPAILPHTRRITFLESNEVAVLNTAGVTFFNSKGEVISKEIVTVNIDAISAAKGGYKHFMQKEIYDQPQALSDTLLGRVDLENGNVKLEDFKFSKSDIAAIEKVTLIGCGTSWHAGLVAKFWIESLAGLPCDVDYGSEFRYRDPILTPNHLLVAITQSGETVDTLAGIEEAKLKKAKVVSVVNVVGSQAARVADGVIYMHAGPEIGVASTKAFITSLADLFLLAVYLGRERGKLGADRAQSLLQSLVEIPNLLANTLLENSIYDQISRKFYTAKDFLYLGRGINYPIALEGALKLKELSYIHAEGYPAGELKHGPIALIDEGLPVVAIVVKDGLYDKVVSAVEQVKARDGFVLAIASEGDELIAGKADKVIYIPNTDPLLMPLLTTIPVQLLSYHLAEIRGCDVDQPRNLAKSVTVE